MRPHGHFSGLPQHLTASAILALSTACLCRGGEIQWVSTIGGSYSDSFNWNGGLVPGGLDYALFDLPDTYTVLWDQSLGNKGFWIGDGQITFDLDGNTYRTDDQGGGGEEYAVRIGSVANQSADLTVTNGFWQNTVETMIGFESGTSGSLTIQGSSTLVDGVPNSVDVSRWFVGRRGFGSLSILDGAQVFGNQMQVGGWDIGDGGYVLVNGAGSHLGMESMLSLGNLTEDPTDLVVSEGASVFAGKLLLQATTAVPATVSASGTGTSIVCGDIDLPEGASQITVSDGAAFSMTDGRIGHFPGSNGSLLVTGSGSSLQADGTITLAQLAGSAGSLRIEDGATASLGSVFTFTSADDVYISIIGPSTSVNCEGLSVNSDLSPGCIIAEGAFLGITIDDLRFAADTAIDGADTVIDCSTRNLRFADNDDPTSSTVSGGASIVAYNASIEADATSVAVLFTGSGTSLDVLNEMTIGTTASSSLTIEDGAEVCTPSLIIGDFGSVTGDVTVGDCGQAIAGGGGVTATTLEIAGTGFISDPTIQVLSGGTLTGDGIVPSNVVNLGGRVAPGGTVLPSLLIDADYDQQVDAGMEIELRGVNAGQYDTLDVSGTASLAGALRILIPDDLTLDLGRHFTILTAGSVTGLFDSIRMTRPNGFRMQPDYQADRVVLTTVQGMTLTVPDLHKNQNATLTITNASPNAQVYLLYSLSGEGTYYVPQLDVTLGIKRPVLAAGPVRTDSSGSVQIVKRVPSVAGNPRVWLQAAQVGDATNVVKKTIQN